MFTRAWPILPTDQERKPANHASSFLDAFDQWLAVLV
jgi:hypothetical protein